MERKGFSSHVYSPFFLVTILHQPKLLGRAILNDRMRPSSPAVAPAFMHSTERTSVAGGGCPPPGCFYDPKMVSNGQDEMRQFLFEWQMCTGGKKERRKKNDA